MTPEQWDATIAVNLRGGFLCTQRAARSMVAHESGGSIVLIGSTEALTPAPSHAHYAASKAGLLQFGRAAALELGQHGIRVNTVRRGSSTGRRSPTTGRTASAGSSPVHPLGGRVSPPRSRMRASSWRATAPAGSPAPTSWSTVASCSAQRSEVPAAHRTGAGGRTCHRPGFKRSRTTRVGRMLWLASPGVCCARHRPRVSVTWEPGRRSGREWPR